MGLNPRVWLRDWLMKPTALERARKNAAADLRSKVVDLVADSVANGLLKEASVLRFALRDKADGAQVMVSNPGNVPLRVETERGEGWTRISIHGARPEAGNVDDVDGKRGDIPPLSDGEVVPGADGENDE